MTIKTADKLSVGDVVLHYGMRLAIDQPITVRDDKIGAVYSTRARIANWDELVAEAGDDVASRVGNSVAAFVVNSARAAMHRGQDAEPRWTVQGNHRATYRIEA
ncbi:hypothetical protein SEA_YEET_233 [Mycobacterium phage Yeet]|nr:hypothetical protein SEA_YEET_233 [Mycobacterium phage Yeet]